MKQDGHETFEEMVGPINSPLRRLGLLAANRCNRTQIKAKAWLWTRAPFVLPGRGPLSELDGGVHIAVHVLSQDPLILYVPVGGRRPLSGLAALCRRLASRRTTFLLMPNWTLERPAVVEQIGKDLAWFASNCPNHELIFLCNTERERCLIEGVGGTAIFSNHNLMISEEVFRPLPQVPLTYDAVYNGRISHTKRHYLAFEIDKLVHVTSSIGELPPAGDRAFLRRLQAQSPRHHIANPIVDGVVGRLTADEVNRVYNQAAVGLCLSAVEGAMYSSMEYLLAGLPIVSTPSIGGRDVYFDPDYCIVCEPEPAAVRRAVERLRDRAIPREEIRGRTLERVRAERLELMDFLSGLRTRLGARQQPVSSWPFNGTAGLTRSRSVRRHARDIEALGAAGGRP